jgi:hypothetical protein
VGPGAAGGGECGVAAGEQREGPAAEAAAWRRRQASPRLPASSMPAEATALEKADGGTIDMDRGGEGEALGYRLGRLSRRARQTGVNSQKSSCSWGRSKEAAKRRICRAARGPHGQGREGVEIPACRRPANRGRGCAWRPDTAGACALGERGIFRPGPKKTMPRTRKAAQEKSMSSKTAPKSTSPWLLRGVMAATLTP